MQWDRQRELWRLRLLQWHVRLHCHGNHGGREPYCMEEAVSLRWPELRLRVDQELYNNSGQSKMI